MVALLILGTEELSRLPLINFKVAGPPKSDENGKTCVMGEPVTRTHLVGFKISRMTIPWLVAPQKTIRIMARNNNFFMDFSPFL
jgi:hypothetical protein